MVRLSTYLFEETRDAVYQQAAQLSLDFMLRFYWNGTIGLDSFPDFNACGSNVERVNWLYTKNQAWLIEGEYYQARVHRLS